MNPFLQLLVVFAFELIFGAVVGLIIGTTNVHEERRFTPCFALVNILCILYSLFAWTMTEGSLSMTRAAFIIIIGATVCFATTAAFKAIAIMIRLCSELVAVGFFATMFVGSLALAAIGIYPSGTYLTAGVWAFLTIVTMFIRRRDTAGA